MRVPEHIVTGSLSKRARLQSVLVQGGCSRRSGTSSIALMRFLVVDASDHCDQQPERCRRHLHCRRHVAPRRTLGCRAIGLRDILLHRDSLYQDHHSSTCGCVSATRPPSASRKHDNCDASCSASSAGRSSETPREMKNVVGLQGPDTFSSPTLIAAAAGAAPGSGIVAFPSHATGLRIIESVHALGTSCAALRCACR